MISNAALSAIMMILRSVAIEWIYIFKSHDFRDSECKCSNPNTSDPNISPRNFMNYVRQTHIIIIYICNTSYKAFALESLLILWATV